jgi:hypothetical protein
MSTEPFASATDCNAAEPAATAIDLATTRRSLRVLFMLSLRRYSQYVLVMPMQLIAT